MNYKLIILIAGIAYYSKASAQASLFHSADTPKVFAPAFISDGFDNRDMTITPSNDFMLFSLHTILQALFYFRKR